MSNKKILKNFGYLSILQILNTAIPFLVYPFLISIFGVEKYGQYLYVMTIGTFLGLIVSFGFNTSSTRKIADSKNNENLIEICSSTIILKSFLLIFSIIISIVVWFLFLSNRTQGLLYFFCMLSLIYDAFFPYWYFQGREKFKYIVLITFLSKVIALLFLLYFIDKDSEIYWIPLINNTSLIVITFIACLQMLKEVGIRIIPFKILWKDFIEASNIFSAQLINQLFELTGRLSVGSFIGESALSYFDLAQKITQLLKLPILSLGSVLFPIASRDKNIKEMLKYTLAIFVVYIVIYIFIISFIDETITLVLTNDMLVAVNVIKIYTLLLLTSIIKQYLSFQVLIPYGFIVEYKKATYVAAAIFIFSMMLLYLSNMFKLEYVVSIIVLSEMAIIFFLFLFYMKNINTFKIMKNNY